MITTLHGPIQLTVEAEICIFNDIYHPYLNTPESISLYDTAYTLNILLDHNSPLEPYSRTLLYQLGYNHLHDICDWHRISVDSPNIKLIQSVMKRIKNKLT